MNAAKAIWAGCEGFVQNQDEVILRGGAAPLVDLLKSTNIDVQATAAGALWSIIIKNSNNQEAMKSTSIFADLVKVLEQYATDYVTEPSAFKRYGEVLRTCSGAISALARNNNSNKDILVERGAVGALLELKDTADKELKKEVTAALSNLGTVQVKERTRTRGFSISAFFSSSPKEEKKIIEDSKGPLTPKSSFRKKPTVNGKKETNKKDARIMEIAIGNYGPLEASQASDVYVQADHNAVLKKMLLNGREKREGNGEEDLEEDEQPLKRGKEERSQEKDEEEQPLKRGKEERSLEESGELDRMESKEEDS